MALNALRRSTCVEISIDWEQEVVVQYIILPQELGKSLRGRFFATFIILTTIT